MNLLIRFFAAECLKWRRDWTILVTFIAPISQVGTILFITWNTADRNIWLGSGFINWYKINFIAWNIVVMPITVAMIVTLSWDLEKKFGTWNHLLVMPSTPLIHFISKLLNHISLTIISLILLDVSIITTGLIQKLFLPDPPMGHMHINMLLNYTIYSFFSALPIINLFAWASFRTTSLGINLSITLTGSWLSFKFLEMRSFICFSPWGLAAQVTQISYNYILPSTWMYTCSGLLILILFILGVFDFKTHKLKKSI